MKVSWTRTAIAAAYRVVGMDPRCGPGGGGQQPEKEVSRGGRLRDSEDHDLQPRQDQPLGHGPRYRSPVRRRDPGPRPQAVRAGRDHPGHSRSDSRPDARAVNSALSGYGSGRGPIGTLIDRDFWNFPGGIDGFNESIHENWKAQAKEA